MRICMFRHVILKVVLLMVVMQTVHADKIIAKDDVLVRSAPASGLFCTRGKVLGTISKGAAIERVRSIQSSCGLFFSYEYFLIKYIDDQGEAHEAYVTVIDNNGIELFQKG